MFGMWDNRSSGDRPETGEENIGVPGGVLTLGDRLGDFAAGIAEGAVQSTTDAALGGYPGYGKLWTYNSGLQLTESGVRWAMIGAGVFGAYLILKGR